MKTHPFPSTRRSLSPAFTLIELLVVMTIIIVLVAGGLGVGRNLMNSAKSKLALKQLKEIGTGIVGYMGDNSGRYPPSLYSSANVTSQEFINPYLYNSSFIERKTPYGTAAFLDPNERDDSVFISPFRKADIDHTIPEGHPATYTPNPLVMPEINPGSKKKRVHTARITRPAEIIIYADTWTNEKGEGAVNFKAQPEIGSGPSNLNMPAAVIEGSYGALHYENDLLHALMGDWSARTFDRRKRDLLRRNLLFGPNESL